jgi:ankyrin repeat protein
MSINTFLCHLARVLLIILACSIPAFCGEIHEAAKAGDLAKVKALLIKNPNLVFSQDNGGATPLHYTVREGHAEVLKYLLTNKADVNARDKSGYTPLYWAVCNKDAAEVLLAHGAKVNARDARYRTPLHLAAEQGHKDVAELFLANKAEVNTRDDRGETPLHLAAEQGHKDLVELLLANKASELPLRSVKEYLHELTTLTEDGGTLNCGGEEGGDNSEYNNCKDFAALKKKGCYGSSMADMKGELSYQNTCQEIDRLKQARPVDKSYFKLNSPDWWKSLPAELIPMRGGLYDNEDDESQAKIALQRLVSRKLLGDIKFENQTVINGEIELVLGVSEHQGCDNVRDVLRFSPVLLADFDHDGIAELLIKGSRMNESKSCFLGTGNGLGAEFGALLKKAGSTKRPILLPYP